MEQSTYIFRHDPQNNELICHREMFPYSLYSSQPSHNKWRRQNSLEAEFNTRIVLHIAVNGHHLGSMCSNLCVYQSKMAADPRLSQKSFALSLALVYSVFVKHYRFVNLAFQ